MRLVASLVFLVLAGTLGSGARAAAEEPVPSPADPSREFPRPLAPGEALRVVVAGDDLLHAAGPRIEALLEATGRAQVELVTRPGSGLASTHSWVSDINDAVDRTGAQLVVAHFGGVDTPPYAVGDDGRPQEPGSVGWYWRWGESAKWMVAGLLRRDAHLLLISTPVPADPGLAERAEAVNLGFQGMLYAFGDRVGFVDPRAGFVGPDGRHAATLPNGGRMLQLRSPDGYGLGADGVTLVAWAVAEHVAARWCLGPLPAPSAAEALALGGRATPGVPPDSGGPGGCPVDSTQGRTAVDDAAPERPRILVAGDSLTWQSVPALTALLEGAGAELRFEVRSTAGLLSQYYDVRGRLRAAVEDFRPDAVVLQWVGGYRPPYLRNPDGSEIEPGSPAYRDAYRDAASELVGWLGARGVRVFWVGGPELQHYVRDGGGLALTGDVAVPLAQTHPGVLTFLDRWRGVLDPSSPTEPGLVPSLTPDERAAWVLFDAVHVTPAGAVRHAEVVRDVLVAAGCLSGPGGCRPPATVAALRG